MVYLDFHTIRLNKVVTNLVLVVVFISGLLSSNICVRGENNYIPPEYIEQELILTQKEKIAFDRFKQNVWANITDEWKDYVKQDLFLLRWIRAKELDVNMATQDMFQFLDFLKKNHISTILTENFEDIFIDFPYHMDAIDRTGRPVGYGSAGDGWNIRRGILQGKRKRLIRYTYRIAFEGLDRVVKMNKKQANVTQFLILLNMENFNPIMHSCAQCISTYISLLDVYERYIPGYVREIIVINAPQTYLLLLEILRPALSPYTRKSLKVFGTNRNNWGPYIYDRVDPKYLPWEFGGEKGKQ